MSACKWCKVAEAMPYPRYEGHCSLQCLDIRDAVNAAYERGRDEERAGRRAGGGSGVVERNRCGKCHNGQTFYGRQSVNKPYDAHSYIENRKGRTRGEAVTIVRGELMTYIRTAEELTNSWNAAKESGRIEERNRIADALEKHADKRGMLRDVTSTYFARAWREFAERLRKGEV